MDSYNPYLLSDEELAKLYAITRRDVIAGKGGADTRTLLTLLDGAWEAREDGEEPPFKPGDLVYLRCRRGQQRNRDLRWRRVKRAFYFGEGRWRLELYGDKVLHLAQRFAKVRFISRRAA